MRNRTAATVDAGGSDEFIMIDCIGLLLVVVLLRSTADAGSIYSNYMYGVVRSSSW
jgi:hypothetical protein